jgi:hypothetical protein
MGHSDNGDGSRPSGWIFGPTRLITPGVLAQVSETVG